MEKAVQDKLNELQEICKKNNVAELYLFGSAAGGLSNGNSDLDFAVVLKEGLSPIEHGDSFISLLFALQDLFDREIDLVSYRVVKNPIFKQELDKTKVSLYAA
ncbi:nucleotidyltransferase family protein [Luteibaculum oceani]|uniref:Nucleotidyltransferase domain-containing protein n=1 Tax=Luteibaculum oceani TaxID=1294296 RepID=A0A5C6VKX7_9FLAO|nr:nucleotidyltransferase domain-containing protein [Luteibaculum oceani]TXC85451.1 nucleotidyltransferase domain-containing protein [Luteibaculum oceani]